jgi:hypothetical protein
MNQLILFQTLYLVLKQQSVNLIFKISSFEMID